MILRSQALTWAANTNLIFPLNFLDPARSMRAPVIKNIAIRGNLTYATGTSGGPARLLPSSLTRIRVSDASKDRVNVRGSSARVIQQVEFGAAYQDGANTAASQGSTTQEFFLNFPFNPWKSRRRNDFGIPLFELIDGGAIELNTGNALLGGAQNTTVASGTYQLFIDVDETRTRELKSRLCYKDVDITQTEFSVPIGGALRWFAFYGGEGGEPAQTPLTAQNFTSQTLEYSILPREVFRNRYRIEQANGARIADATSGTTTVTEDVFVTMQAVMLQMVDKDAKIPEMPSVASLHVQTDGSIVANTPKYIYAYISDRDPATSARTLAAASPAQMQDALAKYGTLKTDSGKISPLSSWSQDVVRSMPVKLRMPSNG